ncbi:hypothetical protein GGF46_004526 [Coemansia sp. RSA 552]|nr:hypothetical protein GGF46_004526 [Coemansia sp. RSA 552]
MPETPMFDITRLPPLVLSRIIAFSDPATWWSLETSAVCALMDTTSFRCMWASELSKGRKVPPKAATLDDVAVMRRCVVDPITRVFGSEAWLTDNLVAALHKSRPHTLAKLVPALLWTLLMARDQTAASRLVQLTAFDLGAFDGRFARELLVQRPELSLLKWLATNGLSFENLYSNSAHCFDMSQLCEWVLSSRMELLQYLATMDVQLPVRSLVEYALCYSSPETVQFLMDHGASQSHVPSWNDVLLMACTNSSTRTDVFRYVVSRTAPSIVWSFAASCLALHAATDYDAYDKFLALRSMPEAATWMVKPVQGRTPIDRLCDRLTYENMPYISPFIRAYMDLGVSAAGMPEILGILCESA